MTDVQLDSMINNFISRVKEVFMRWYDTSDKSFNPVLTLESGTVLEEITTNNDELIQTLKNRDTLEDNMKTLEAEAEMQSIQDEIDELEKDRKEKENIINLKILADQKKADVEKDKYTKLQETIAEQVKIINEGDALIASYEQKKADRSSKKTNNDVDIKRLGQEYKDAQLLTDADEKKTKIEKLQEDNNTLLQQNAQYVHDIKSLDKLLTDLNSKKLQIEREQKITTKENKDQVALIKKQQVDDTKEMKRLRDKDAKEQKELDEDLELRIAPVLQGLAKFNAERTAANALKEKVLVIKDKMSDKRLKEVYDAIPITLRNPEDPDLETHFREAVRKVFKEKDNVNIHNNSKLIYSNNYDKFKTLAIDNFRPNDLNKDIFDAIKGNDAKKLDEKFFKTEFIKIIKSDPQKSDLSNYKTYAINRLAKTPTKSISITTKGKAEGTGRQKLSKSLKDLLKKYNF